MHIKFLLLGLSSISSAIRPINYCIFLYTVYLLVYWENTLYSACIKYSKHMP